MYCLPTVANRIADLLKSAFIKGAGPYAAKGDHRTVAALFQTPALRYPSQDAYQGIASEPILILERLKEIDRVPAIGELKIIGYEFQRYLAHRASPSAILPSLHAHSIKESLE